MQSVGNVECGIQAREGAFVRRESSAAGRYLFLLPFWRKHQAWMNHVHNSKVIVCRVQLIEGHLRQSRVFLCEILP
jgi:hypothetical protein